MESQSESPNLSFAILTVSDTHFKDPKGDLSGPKLQQAVSEAFPNSTISNKQIVPDEKDQIIALLNFWVLSNVNIILTTGGTGFSPRDITPEATKAVIDREAPGITLAMTSRSLSITDMAMVSRAACGIKNKTLIVNLPGSPKGAVECFGFIRSCLPHAIAVLTENSALVRTAHCAVKETTFDSYYTPSKVKLDVTKRDRKSPYPLIEVDRAIAIMLESIMPTIKIELVPVESCRTRILAENVYATTPIPNFPTSMKDGYAVKVRDGTGERRVRDVVAAGDAPHIEALQSGEVIRISTGAVVPPGADAVIPVENTTLIAASEDKSKELTIRIDVRAVPNQDIRPVGVDIPANSLVLNKGNCISAAHQGVLATLGKTKVKVYSRASVGILSTGNEVRNIHEKLAPGQIHDSNKITLINLLAHYGYDSNDCGIAKDNPDSLKRALCKVFTHNDILVTTGGVSMGEFDILKQVLLEDFDAYIHFGRINMKPGKPTTFATLYFNGKLKIIFGLPGNPASACVTCLLFVIPCLKYLERHSKCFFPKKSVELAESYNNTDIRPEYLRVNIYNDHDDGLLKACPLGSQLSSRLNSLVNCNGLVIFPGQTEFNYGSKQDCEKKFDALIIDPIY